MTHFLQAFLPPDRARALAEGHTLPDPAWGSILRADISGFTKLAEALVRHWGAQRGSELLGLHLNQTYEALIRPIDAAGGSIIGFAGDSLLAWFDGDDGERAAACGLAMQHSLAAAPPAQLPGGETLVTTAKVDITSGSVRRLVVGDPEVQCFDVLAGATLYRVGALDKETRAGEVALDGATARALGVRLFVREWRSLADGSSLAIVERLRATDAGEKQGAGPPPSLGAGELRSWVAAQVYEQLQLGESYFFTELRPAVALFLSIGGIDYDRDSEAAQKLDLVVRQLQEELRPLDGILVDITLVDEETVFYVAFGAPRAHDDDARRALHLAWQLRARFARLPWDAPIKLGLSQGTMRTGVYGSASRHTYGVLGDPVNLAFRLLQRAQPGQILVSGPLQESVVGLGRWHAQADQPIKGKAEPCPVFELEALTHPASALSPPEEGLPLVGREAELAQVASKLAALAHGEGAILALVGEPGIGKSRLAIALAELARAQGFNVLSSGCRSSTSIIPYAAWLPIWQPLFLPDQERTSESVPHLTARLAEGASELAPLVPLLGPLLGLTVPETERTAPMGPPQRKLELERLLVAWLEGWLAHPDHTPLVLILDDCQWLDTLSLDLLLALAQAIPRLSLLLVVLYRSEGAEALQGRLCTLPTFTEIGLHELSAAEAETLLLEKGRQLFGATFSPDPRWGSAFLERTGGNPFYLGELLHLLGQPGTSAADESALPTPPLPASLYRLLLSRIDQLPPPERLLLKLASILDGPFQAGWLSAIYPVLGSKEVVKQRLKELQRLEFVTVERSAGIRSYRLKHALLQEALLSLQPHAQQRQFHQAVAEWYERQAGESPLWHVARLAFHWTKAEVWDKALHYLVAAGEQAARLYGFVEARRHYLVALGLLAPPARVELSPAAYADLIIKYAAVAYAAESPPTLLARLVEAETTLGVAADDEPSAADRQRLAWLHYWQGRMCFALNLRAEALAHHRLVLRYAEQLADKELQAIPAAVTGWILTLQGHFDEAAYVLTQAKPRLEEIQRWTEWIGTMGHLGVALAATGQYAAGLALRQQLYERARAIQNSTGIAVSYLFLARIHFLAGRLALASEAIAQGVATTQQSGDQVYTYIALGFQGWIESRLGHPEVAQQKMGAALAILKEMGGRLVLGEWFAAAQAEIAWQAGQGDEALRRAQAAVVTAQEVGGLFAQGIAYRVWGQALAARGAEDWEEADLRLRSSLDCLVQSQARLELALTHLAQAALYRQRDDSESAARAERAARVHLASLGLEPDPAGAFPKAKEIL